MVAQSWDVAARRAEGRSAVDHVSEYVLACSRLGFQHEDLTTHPAQVRDWYDDEDGLDLRALDADCSALAAAAVVAEDAARTHVALVAELSGAWSGRGAMAAGEFASRSGEAATTVESAVRGAAGILVALRDELWRAVDAKVAAVQAIDGRHDAQQEQWLAAARAVTTGGGDLASASELVDQQVKPFVANDIGSDWVGAMRAAAASIGAAYDMAIVRISAGPPAVFDVPGALGPRAEPRGRSASSGDGFASAAVTPAASGAPAASAGPTVAAQPGPAWSAPAAMSPAAMSPAALPPAASPAADPMAGAPSMGGLGGAAPGLGSGTSGFGQQLADLIGGLIGSFGGTDDLAGSDDTPNESVDDPVTGGDDPGDLDDDAEDPADPADPADPEDPEEVDDEAAPEPAEEVVGEPVDGPVEPPADPAVPEPTAPPPTSPPPLPSDPSLSGPVEPTPCEIAADELPQVGE